MFPLRTEVEEQYLVTFIHGRCAHTLIRNLRVSSTRVIFVRPALWQMDTLLVDQAVEKFNLKRNNTRKMYL